MVPAAGGAGNLVRMAAPDGTIAVRAAPGGDAVVTGDDRGENLLLVLKGPSI